MRLVAVLAVAVSGCSAWTQSPSNVNSVYSGTAPTAASSSPTPSPSLSLNDHIDSERASKANMQDPVSHYVVRLHPFSRRHAVAMCMKAMLGAAASTATVAAVTAEPAYARYVLDEETGDYVEIEDVDWQTAWKQRLDKAQSMSTDEIFTAARGAGNLNLKSGAESSAAQKRRAMSMCRDAGMREKAKAGSEKECVARVFGGETAFMLDVQ